VNTSRKRRRRDADIRSAAAARRSVTIGGGSVSKMSAAAAHSSNYQPFDLRLLCVCAASCGHWIRHYYLEFQTTAHLPLILCLIKLLRSKVFFSLGEFFKFEFRRVCDCACILSVYSAGLCGYRISSRLRSASRSTRFKVCLRWTGRGRFRRKMWLRVRQLSIRCGSSCRSVLPSSPCYYSSLSSSSAGEFLTLRPNTCLDFTKTCCA